MELKLFVTVFASVFLAELGDKTQVATVLFAADQREARLIVFAAAASALVVSSAIGVLLGSTISGWMNPKLISRIAGVAFVLIGVWTYARA